MGFGYMWKHLALAHIIIIWDVKQRSKVQKSSSQSERWQFWIPDLKSCWSFQTRHVIILHTTSLHYIQFVLESGYPVIRLSGCNLNRLSSRMYIGLSICVIDTCRYICIGAIKCWESVVDTCRICCQHGVHVVDKLSTDCQAVPALYRIPYAFVIWDKILECLNDSML